MLQMQEFQANRADVVELDTVRQHYRCDCRLDAWSRDSRKRQTHHVNVLGESVRDGNQPTVDMSRLPSSKPTHE